ncbi:hypothetical protein FQN55_000198 [Onygenales sp. PD_40]|nr:hypothetical protein FQN55_000198 [Onygenales sp. PD_40]KAK2792225.1 hypothetical protein FQN51_001884 [Onygenales sp. PD_10]KAK2792452.1 hypothetical protein FQN52_003387 [Onygenales sp. PD_12]
MADTTSPSEVDLLVLPPSEPYMDHSHNLWKFISTPLIEVRVGTDLVRSFNVHEGLLKSQSLFFRGMLRNNFAETKNGVIDLPADDVRTFAMFLQWLYTGKSHDGVISASPIEVSPPDMEEPLTDLHRQTQSSGPLPNGGSNPRLLFSSYIFADKIQSPWFKNHIHNRLITVAQDSHCPKLSVDDIRYVYNNTPATGDILLRCCLVMSCGRHMESLMDDPKFMELCFEVKQFGMHVLQRCRTRMGSASAAAPSKPKARKRA